MRMKKRRTAVLSALLLVILIAAAGCSGSSSDTAEQTTTAVENVTADTAKETASTEDEAQAADADKSLAVPSVNGALSVTDGRLTDESGEPVQLRGISTHGLAWFPEYVNEDCFADLKSWHANVVRLAMYTAESGGYCTDGDPEELKRLVKDGVDYAAAEDMYAIVDWHILSDGNPLTYQSEAETFFEEMSAEFSEYNNVLYEICNEPNGDTDWSDIKAYAEDIIPIIRGNDPDAVIIVGTPTWSQDIDKAAADPITDYDNIMYTLHFYAATHKDDLRDRLAAAADAGLPVFVTEYGICDASGSGAIDTASADAWVALMNEYGISYAAWNLSNKDETSAIIDSGVSKTSGFSRDDLSESGKWVYDMLMADGKVTAVSEEAASNGSDDGGMGSGEAGSGGTDADGSGTGTFVTDDGLSVTVKKTNDWQSGAEYFCQFTASVENVSDEAKSDWEFRLNFNEKLDLSDSWNGTFKVNGKTLTIKNAEYNGELAVGDAVEDIGFIVSGKDVPAVEE